MEIMAKALVISMSYFELWDDEVIDPDTAIRALQSVSAELEDATPAEIKAIAKVASQLAKKCQGRR